MPESLSCLGMDGIDEVVLAAREQMVFGWARSHSWPVAFVIAGDYLGDDVGRRQLVDLHRATILAAAIRTRSSPPPPRPPRQCQGSAAGACRKVWAPQVGDDRGDFYAACGGLRQR